MDQTSNASCPPAYPLVPEQTPGPQIRHPKPLRRNISQGAEGLPLILRLHLVDAMTGNPVTGALVDIWHCNAPAAYPGCSRIGPDEEVDVEVIGAIPRPDDDTYLRGSQLTDKKGTVRFTTIYPGFDAGRALHIHVAVRIVNGGDCLDERQVAWLGQMYFPQVTSRAALNAKADRGRTAIAPNDAEDIAHAATHSQASTLTVWPIGRDSHEDGYFGHLTIGIDTFAVSMPIKPEDFDKYTV